MTTQTLENITLHAHEILVLIKEFYTNFHPLFPILPTQADFLEAYDANKLLLWTIITIACKESAEYSQLYITLVDPVRRLAGDLYNIQSRDFETIQALLLLCIWPFPFQQTINDPSPMYCGLATQLSYQLGLHRPNLQMHWEYGATTSNTRVNLGRSKVWLGCFVVNHAISARLGTPSTIQPGHAILSELARGPTSELPVPLLGYIHISYIGMKGLQALGDDISSATGRAKYPTSLVTIFDQKLITMRESLGSKWSDLTEIYFLTTKLQIIFFALDEDSYPESIFTVDVSSLVIYDQACTTTQRLLEVAASNAAETPYWPIHGKHAAVYGTIMAFRLACIAQAGSNQRALLQQAIERGASLIKSWSMFPKDSFARISSHIDYLSRKLARNQRESMPKLSSSGIAWQDVQPDHETPSYKPFVKSRMAADVLYDTIWAGKYGALEEEQRSQELLSQDTNQFTSPTLPEINLNPDIGFPNGPEEHRLDTVLNDTAFFYRENSEIMDIFEDWESLIGNSL
ncbi:fungal-specific transcription factor domain-containing protein [Talaromyces proteolyticus]|uniref:Fungal-specific transcription factor domain-containing protein n=1 Tax=Talaromyces proteolyticus TaxID=1131652 RepID=A0AAD4L160_9EURO|nr:fungal-specific transcription factor domain-containing protein [Talaromyces proteolyticus]KAH8705209.1 fungal-specific transcription factor domain-containing protein [Talaromyces proteolyticus]